MKGQARQPREVKKPKADKPRTKPRITRTRRGTKRSSLDGIGLSGGKGSRDKQEKGRQGKGTDAKGSVKGTVERRPKTTLDGIDLRQGRTLDGGASPKEKRSPLAPKPEWLDTFRDPSKRELDRPTKQAGVLHWSDGPTPASGKAGDDPSKPFTRLADKLREEAKGNARRAIARRGHDVIEQRATFASDRSTRATNAEIEAFGLRAPIKDVQHNRQLALDRMNDPKRSSAERKYYQRMALALKPILWARERSRAFLDMAADREGFTRVSDAINKAWNSDKATLEDMAALAKAMKGEARSRDEKDVATHVEEMSESFARLTKAQLAERTAASSLEAIQGRVRDLDSKRAEGTLTAVEKLERNILLKERERKETAEVADRTANLSLPKFRDWLIDQGRKAEATGSPEDRRTFRQAHDMYDARIADAFGKWARDDRRSYQDLVQMVDAVSAWADKQNSTTAWRALNSLVRSFEQRSMIDRFQAMGHFRKQAKDSPSREWVVDTLRGRYERGLEEHENEVLITGKGRVGTRGNLRLERTREYVTSMLQALEGDFIGAAVARWSDNPDLGKAVGGISQAFGGAAKGRNEIRAVSATGPVREGPALVRSKGDGQPAAPPKKGASLRGPTSPRGSRSGGGLSPSSQTKTEAPKVPGGKAAPAAPKAPRLRPGEPFDASRRRPNQRLFPDVEAGPVDRHDGVRTIPSARVSVFKHQVSSRLRGEHQAVMKVLLDPKATPKARQEAGYRYEAIIVKDLRAADAAGKALRTRSAAADKGRTGDVGAYEVTAASKLRPDKLDQVWRDLAASGRAVLTVPRLSDADGTKLAKMAAVFERFTGKRPHILVRETAP